MNIPLSDDPVTYAQGQPLWWHSQYGTFTVEFAHPSKSGKRAYVYRIKDGKRQYSTWVTFEKLSPRITEAEFIQP